MKICVLGCGAFGIALSLILDENGYDVFMWTPLDDEKQNLESLRSSSKLPGINIPNSIKITTNITEACEGSVFVVLAIPTAFIRSTLENIKESINNKLIVIASKGIEQESCLFIPEIIEEVLKINNVAVLSGPSFAIDVANKGSVGLTLACDDMKNNSIVTKAFSNEHFKIIAVDDIIGVEVCGAIKNVMAIASGILKGMGATESTMSLFITEAINSIGDLIVDLGGKRTTVLSLAGIGDLLLTCTSSKSRNYSFGYLIGNGGSKKQISDFMANNTVEGVYTLKSIYQLVLRKNVDAPVIELINDIVDGKKEPECLIDFLMKN